MNDIEKTLAIALAALVVSTGSVAAVSADEARQLGTTLTPFGAEKAGNADGSIPAYSGEVPPAPAGYKPGSGRYPDPYPNDKLLLRIDGKNAAQYKDQLTPGVLAMLQQYPSFYLGVYPTHRDAPYPKWVLDNSVRNATRAELTGEVHGDGVKNAYGGIPFPIPKNGDEVLWNFRMRYIPADTVQRQGSYLMDSSGRQVFLGRYLCKFANEYYDPASTAMTDPYFYKQLCLGEAPVSQAGYNLLINYSNDYGAFDQLTWVYTAGQRRVRTAPEFTYDTPAANFGGALIYDEVNVFSGRADRFDMKLVGKKELFVPYDTAKVFAPDASNDKFLTPKHPNPDYIRWEKHRVFVVEGTLKKGKRHILSRRTFFVDEDSWQIVATDGYDQSGKLYRVGLDLPILVYDDKTNAPFISGQLYNFTDLSKGEYFTSFPDANGRYDSKNKLPDLGAFTSSRLAATGVR